MGTALHVEDKERHKKKALVPALQLVQQAFRLLAVQGKVRGQNIHIVAAADGLFLFLYFHAVEVGYIAPDMSLVVAMVCTSTE